jgi:hypothetical protein
MKLCRGGFTRVQAFEAVRSQTESCMRQFLPLMAIVIGASAGLGFSLQPVAAQPIPALSLSHPAAMAIERIGYWKRNWRRYGYGPGVVVPGADVDVDVDVDTDAPAVVVLPPPRPASCGQYRYWNGDRCIDARYHDPYLGPK